MFFLSFREFSQGAALSIDTPGRRPFFVDSFAMFLDDDCLVIWTTTKVKTPSEKIAFSRSQFERSD